MLMCLYVCQRPMWGIFLGCIPPYFLNHSLSLNPELSDLAKLTAFLTGTAVAQSQPERSLGVVSLHTELQGH